MGLFLSVAARLVPCCFRFPGLESHPSHPEAIKGDDTLQVNGWQVPEKQRGLRPLRPSVGRLYRAQLYHLVVFCLCFLPSRPPSCAAGTAAVARQILGFFVQDCCTLVFYASFGLTEGGSVARVTIASANRRGSFARLNF